ncbi:tail completion protein gp17 [Paenibacillus gallinarum]|uniref:DUF3168 domain-containing protein n=1 Tax=Paenibacillus gallinarum TaxID=2762232 RepID=A0ABR8SW80_9BACL|nr:DUF3168 domain-containing protein [Paenibacillus gallinarum]MBD7967765.1 DUF3168 domain-containing protein [Paenibacillus gallinarum]
MIDLKQEILTALRSDPGLASVLGKDTSGKVKVYPETSPEAVADPYITFFELTNFDKSFADNIALKSEIHFQVDVWSKSNTSPIALHANRVMESLGFYRSGAADQFENATRTYHKVLRYKTTQLLGG